MNRRCWTRSPRGKGRAKSMSASQARRLRTQSSAQSSRRDAVSSQNLPPCQLTKRLGLDSDEEKHPIILVGHSVRTETRADGPGLPTMVQQGQRKRWQGNKGHVTKERVVKMLVEQWKGRQRIESQRTKMRMAKATERVAVTPAKDKLTLQAVASVSCGVTT
eukprot:2983527-Amphidinium_carterae.1